jgi:tRNA modification GTPase
LILVHSRCDLPERSGAPVGSLCVSARTGEGIGGLLEVTKVRALEILPAEGDLALNRRQAQLLTIAYEALSRAVHHDLVIFAEEVRTARSTFDQLTGRAGVEDLLDQLFGRFCLGK